MTERELNQIYYLDKQIARLKRRIAELKGEMIGSAGFGAGGHSPTPGNPTERLAMKKVELLEELNDALEKKMEAEITIRSFIESCPDPEIKTIMELRFLYQMSWQDIAVEISPRHKDYDRTTVSKKLRKFLKENS